MTSPDRPLADAGAVPPSRTVPGGSCVSQLVINIEEPLRVLATVIEAVLEELATASPTAPAQTGATRAGDSTPPTTQIEHPLVRFERDLARWNIVDDDGHWAVLVAADAFVSPEALLAAEDEVRALSEYMGRITSRPAMTEGQARFAAADAGWEADLLSNVVPFPAAQTEVDRRLTRIGAALKAGGSEPPRPTSCDPGPRS